MLIIPHSPDSDLARQPWITWAIVVLSLLIYIAQESSRGEVLSSAATYCDKVFSDPVEANNVAWNNPEECASDLANLHSLPDPEYIIDRSEKEPRFFSGWQPEQIDSYFETLRKHYPAFALISPPSLDAKLTNPNVG